MTVRRRPIRLLLLAGLLSLLPAVSPALAAADVATLEQAEGLIQAGKAEQAYQLLEPLETSSAGDLAYDYLLATSALESGRPSKATFIYERILAIDPSYIGVRADMGRAYFALGDFGRAKIEFETVLSFQNLPPDLRSSVEKYVAATESRTQAKATVIAGYVELGFGRDTNIGSSTDKPSLLLPVGPTPYSPLPPTGLKTADNYATLGLGAELNHQINPQWGLYVGGDYRTRAYGQYNDANFWTADSRAGVSYAGGRWLLRGGITAGEYVYHGARMRDSYGLTADWRYAVDNANQLTLSGSATRYDYVAPQPNPLLIQDNNTYSSTLGWMHSFGDGTTLINLSATYSVEDALSARDDGNKKSFGPRILIQKNFNPTLGGYITAGYTRSHYQDVNDSYYGLKRKESLYDVTAALTWTVSKGLSLRPQVSWTRNRANAELFAYDKADTSVTLRYDF